MFITWDLATKEGDYSCKIYWRKGKYGNVYIENVEYFNKKEVKKVNKPYFELKVVKVKKEKLSDCPDSGRAICLTCGEKLYHIPKQQSKGNYVNNENLDKIKFPCFCSYIDEDKERHIGMLNRYVDQYRLYNMEKQSEDNFIDDCTSLENLIKSYDIQILKGKLIIFEEEE